MPKQKLSLTKSTCEWLKQPHWLLDLYNTECGHQYVEWEDNNFAYCPYCGKPIQPETRRSKMHKSLDALKKKNEKTTSTTDRS